jgi:hypothetical protein
MADTKLLAAYVTSTVKMQFSLVGNMIHVLKQYQGIWIIWQC